MEVTIDDVKKVSILSRIKLTDEEIIKYKTELSKIISVMDDIENVDVSGIKPLYSIVEDDLYLREDCAKDHNLQQVVLKNAKNAKNVKYNYYSVPKII